MVKFGTLNQIVIWKWFDQNSRF